MFSNPPGETTHFVKAKADAFNKGTIDNDGNEQIQHGEGGDQDERHKEGPTCRPS